MRCVVDASVAAKWFLNEEYSDAAGRLLRDGNSLLAPAFLLLELSSVFSKKVRQNVMSRNEADTALAATAVSVTATWDSRFVSQAFDIALRHQRSVYDALYVAVALQEGCQLVTADERLYNGLTSVFPGTMLWVGDVPV